LTVVTTLLRARKNDRLADAIEKTGSRVDAKIAVSTVDAENDLDGTFNFRFFEHS